MSLDHGSQLPVFDVEFSPDDNLIITAISSGTIHIWPLSGGESSAFEAHPLSPVFDIDFGWIGKQQIMLSASKNRQVKLWTFDIADGPPEYVGRLPGHLDGVNSVAYGEGQIATAGEDGTVRSIMLTLANLWPI